MERTQAAVATVWRCSAAPAVAARTHGYATAAVRWLRTATAGTNDGTTHIAGNARPSTGPTDVPWQHDAGAFHVTVRGGFYV